MVAASDDCVESCGRCYQYNNYVVGVIGCALYTPSYGPDLLEIGQRYLRNKRKVGKKQDADLVN